MKAQDDNSRPLETTIDQVMFAIANMMNVFMIYIFLSRTGLFPPLGIFWAWIWSILIIVTLGVVTVNIRLKRKWWYIALPGLLIVFLIFEILLDYVLDLEFRSSRLLGPYLLLYYFSLMGMIGYAFQIGRKRGFITLITYFLNQIATFYSYFLVGHGT